MSVTKAMDRKWRVSVLGTILVIALTVSSGIIQGRMSNRWGQPRDLLLAAEKLQQIPKQFGGWQLQSSEKLPRSTIDMLQCPGYLLGAYANQQTGETVRVTVLVGPAVPMSTHTPEICFSSREYSIQDERRRVPIDIGGSAETFWATTFRSNRLEGDMLVVYYAWNSDGHWAATDDPRFTFAGSPFLYKIQLAGSIPAGVDPKGDDSCARFLKDFVPAARPYLAKAR